MSKDSSLCMPAHILMSSLVLQGRQPGLPDAAPEHVAAGRRLPALRAGLLRSQPLADARPALQAHSSAAARQRQAARGAGVRRARAALAEVVAAAEPRRGAHQAQAARASHCISPTAALHEWWRWARSSPDGADKQPAQAHHQGIFRLLHGGVLFRARVVHPGLTRLCGGKATPATHVCALELAR